MAEVLSFDRRRRTSFPVRRPPWRRAIPPWLPLVALVIVAGAAHLAVGPPNSVAVTGALARAGYPNGAAETRTFRLCGVMSQQNCVVDGDTIRHGGVKIRLADIDAPEVSAPKCAFEAALGNRATQQLVQLMNAGPFEVIRAGGRDEDMYGRKLRVIVRDGRSVADTLVASKAWRRAGMVRGEAGAGDGDYSITMRGAARRAPSPDSPCQTPRAISA